MQPVAARLSLQTVTPLASEEPIIPTAAPKDVLAVRTPQLVGPIAADQAVCKRGQKTDSKRDS